MEVVQLWRYPVKSAGGEQLEECLVEETGVEGDRRWGLVDLRTGNVLTARREPRLLFATARLRSPEEVVITLPSGESTSDSAALSAWLGRPVELRRAGSAGGTYEAPLDVEHDEEWVSWVGPANAWHDSALTRVSLVTTGSLGSWDVRRFRPNIVLDGANEEDLVGKMVTVGSVVLEVSKRIDRCVMVTRPQPGLARDLTVLRSINRERGGHFAIGALVRTPGAVRVGNIVEGV